MTHAKPVLFIATRDIPSIGALKGQYVLDDGSGVLFIMHEVPASSLTAEDRETGLVPALYSLPAMVVDR